MTKKVLIIGGGIAGPVTAMALHKAGIDSVVYEAYGHGSDGVGAFLTVAVNGLEALRVLDLHEVVGRLGMATPRMRIRSGTGKMLAEFANPSRTVKRADLYQALRDEAVRRGITFEYGKRLTDAAVTHGGVVARFADGGTAEGDLLIGADGLRSRTRQIIDAKAPAAQHVGLLNTGGYAYGLNLSDEKGMCHFVFGKRCFFGYMPHPNGEVWWFANPPSKREPTPGELAAITQAQWRTRLMDLFKDDSGPMLDIIRATPDIISGWEHLRLPTGARVAQRSDGHHRRRGPRHVPELGAGCFAGDRGRGGAREMPARHRRPGQAFAAYEKLRRERVEKVVAQGRRNGTGKAPGAVGRWVRDLVLPPIMRGIAKRNSLAWMFDYRIDWAEKVAAMR
jgi:2-polyprenyl-6-methoxyphenol hydroxylase-like FAD-dependent oxidoreductase